MLQFSIEDKIRWHSAWAFYYGYWWVAQACNNFVGTLDDLVVIQALLKFSDLDLILFSQSKGGQKGHFV